MENIDKKVISYYASFYEVSKDLDKNQFYEFNMAIFSVMFFDEHIDNINFNDKILNLLWKSIKHSINSSVKGFCSKKEIPYDDMFKGVAKGVANKEKEKEKEKGKDKENTPVILNPLLNEESYSEWVAFKKIKVKGTITKLINFLIEYDKPTQKVIVDNSIMNNYKGLFPPKNLLAKQQPIKPKEKTLDEVLNIYIHQRKIHTNKDYTFAKCKEMLHWNLHKEFTKLSTSFEEEMMLAYGYDWVNGKINFSTDGNIIDIESK
tara:strand:- start:65 stop:850 length:786 start_codon:yes stop_codon:yes gene_type:complete